MSLSNVRAPSVYGAAQLPKMRTRSSGALGAAVRRQLALAPRIFGAMPPQALLGFTAISTGPNEDTGSANSFHEIGYWNVEAGPSSGPAPSPDPRAANNHWGRDANDPEVVRLNGAPASMVADGWKVPAGASPDVERQKAEMQTAVGLVNLRKHRDAAIRKLQAGARPLDPNSVYGAVVMFAAYSAGDTGAARVFNRYAAAIGRATTDPAKLGAFLEALLAEVQRLPPSGRPAPWNRAAHGNPAYTAMRSMQKVASGRALAAEQNDAAALAWFGPAGIVDAERVLTDGASGGAGAVAPPPPPPPNVDRNTVDPAGEPLLTRVVRGATAGALVGAGVGAVSPAGPVLGAGMGAVAGAVLGAAGG